MKVLVCGAHGFIGRHVVDALQAAGHAVVRGMSRPSSADDVAMDFSRDVSPADWLPRLQGVEVVVNAVGVLRDTRRRPMQAVHVEAPRALFEACTRTAVRRLIHVSALGIDGNPTLYARTKREGENAALACHAPGRLAVAVLRPSIVFGPGGESSALFLNLARLPWLPLPRPALQTRVQPVHVRELALAVARLADADLALNGRLDCAGPEPVSLAGFIASLRMQLGHRPPGMLGLPHWLTRLSAQVGDRIPLTPWGSEALALLTQDNVGDPGAMTQLLGRSPTRYGELLALGRP
ncbi:NAD-dependent epimerase/dehydratase family protein [uncultured Pseudacidovorax sp.]|uniref:NAD-dependent epimerase/dehydratase family protein n=1 Tax=uncultured Pseudacidovorax sp. TaxID=679313 RepID=UPI0025EF4686|nr:NAD-dependent epimerase/dehydratase family protein [uncultured Pseudacidovorax sp.]